MSPQPALAFCVAALLLTGSALAADLKPAELPEAGGLKAAELPPSGAVGASEEPDEAEGKGNAVTFNVYMRDGLRFDPPRLEAKPGQEVTVIL
jgi:hypothetical protein